MKHTQTVQAGAQGTQNKHPMASGEMTAAEQAAAIRRKTGCKGGIMAEGAHLEDTQEAGKRIQNAGASEDSYFDVYSDDGEEPQLLLGWGRKWDVFGVLRQYDPQTVRVTELDRADEFANKICALNGEEWLRQNNCPTCGRSASIAKAGGK